MDYSKLKFDTIQIHAGRDRDDATCARGIAIRPTSAYTFPSCDYAARLFELSQPGNIYTRLQNPTTAAYEERIAALYGGVGALATSSGMSAILTAITSLASGGDTIVASPFLYGGTYNLFRHTLRRLGINVAIAESADPADFARALESAPRVRAVFAESMGNPTCDVVDIEALASIAHDARVPLIIDNTFGAGGYLCNPLQWGADIIVDSATKWINGHGTAMGGIIVDGGKFDWTGFDAVDAPDAGYHGLNFREAFGPAAFITKCRVDGLRDLGTCPSPFDSYLMLLGLETLSLRVRHQAESTRRIATYLRNHPRVKRVSYVGFEDHPSHALAAKYFRGGGSCVFNVELKGTLDSTVRFVEALKLVTHMTMIGDSISVVTHPASTTHKQLSEADLAKAGVTPTLLRVSPGLEDPDDIIADFEQAFEAIDR